MKFGERILKEIHPAWADHYLPYNSLKQILKALIIGAPRPALTWSQPSLRVGVGGGDPGWGGAVR